MKKKRLFLILSLILCQVAGSGLMAMEPKKLEDETPCGREGEEKKLKADLRKIDYKFNKGEDQKHLELALKKIEQFEQEETLNKLKSANNKRLDKQQEDMQKHYKEQKKLKEEQKKKQAKEESDDESDDEVDYEFEFSDDDEEDDEFKNSCSKAKEKEEEEDFDLD